MSLRSAVLVTILLLVVPCLAGCTGSRSPVTAPAPVLEPTTMPPPLATTAVMVTTTAPWPSLETPATGHPYSKRYTFEGSGDFLHTFATTSDGTWIVRMSFPGQGNVSVLLQDEQRDLIAVLADTTGSYTGTETIRLSEGTYYLDVAADAPWVITLTST